MILVHERRTALDDFVDEMSAVGVARPAADLFATVRLLRRGCVGLAAPQLGRPARVLVVDVDTRALARCDARAVYRRG